MTFHRASRHFGQEYCRPGEQDTRHRRFEYMGPIHITKTDTETAPIQREGMCDFELCL